MSKLKIFFISLLSSLIFLGISPAVSADVHPGTNYEIVSNLVVKDTTTGEVLKFYTVELRDAFLQSQSGYQTRSNATGVADYRTTYLRSYNDTATSGAVSPVSYGGKAGSTITANAGVSFSKNGFGFSLGSSVTYKVPPYTYGYIRLKASYTVRVSKLEVRYLGTNNWVPAGESSSISNVRIWSELATWK